MSNVQASTRTTLLTLRPTGCYIHFGILCEEGRGCRSEGNKNSSMQPVKIICYRVATGSVSLNVIIK
jgi:hypothetical protein